MAEGLGAQQGSTHLLPQLQRSRGWGATADCPACLPCLAPQVLVSSEVWDGASSCTGAPMLSEHHVVANSLGARVVKGVAELVTVYHCTR